MTETITGTLTDYALMDEGQFTGFYGARINDHPYVVMHHVDSFLLRLEKGSKVEANLNKDGHISKIQRQRAAPAAKGSSADASRPREQIDREREEYNARARGAPTGQPGVTDIGGDAIEAAKRRAAGFDNPPERVEDEARRAKEAATAAAAGNNHQETCTSPEPPAAPITTDGIGRIVAETKARNNARDAAAIVPAQQPRTITHAAPQYSNEEVLLVRNIAAKNCTEPEFKLLMYMAKTYGLDPLLKQIWAVKRNERDPALIFAGRDGMLAVAHRSGQLDGMQSGVIYEGTGKDRKPVSAWCEIWRKDMTHPFKTEVPFSEYNTGVSVWKTNPSAMILKVAESVCLRKAFSIAGIYCPEEMPDQPGGA